MHISDWTWVGFSAIYFALNLAAWRIFDPKSSFYAASKNTTISIATSLLQIAMFLIFFLNLMDVVIIPTMPAMGLTVFIMYTSSAWRHYLNRIKTPESNS